MSGSRSAPSPRRMLPRIDRPGRLPMDLELLGAQVLPPRRRRRVEALAGLAEEDEAQRLLAQQPALAVRVLEDWTAESVVEETRRHNPAPLPLPGRDAAQRVVPVNVAHGRCRPVCSAGAWFHNLIGELEFLAAIARDVGHAHARSWSRHAAGCGKINDALL